MRSRPAALIQDDYTGEPASKRLLAHLQKKREEGKKIAGIYCGYAPAELIRAMDIVPAPLCAFSHKTIEAAETVLPSNLCPLIKSSYGFVVTDTCPFYGISDVIVGETTCDGKKKMFELISERKPTHIMDLPQLPDEAEALSSWILMIRKLQRFLEDIFGTRVTDEEIETAIKDTNHKNRMIREVIAFAAFDPPLLGWQEIYELTHLSHGATGKEMEAMLTEAVNRLNQRRDAGYVYGPINAPRVMLTGCPFGGDVQKVLDIVEESGGTIVALESCSGYKPFMLDIAEDTGDPIKALAERYLKIPCSCMTPNTRRLTEIGRMIDLFRPHAVIDLVLQACHSFNIESYKVGEYVQKNIGLPFLKIVTDFSQSDVGQIRTRVEALLESC